MTGQELIHKLRRLHTLLTIEKRSNNLAYAIRRGIDFIGTWKLSPDEMLRRTPIKVLFAGYGPKFIRIVSDIIETGSTPMLDEMQARNDPFFCELCEIPSIGVVMARRMYFDRSIRTMNDLRIAYTNHVLQRIPAFGEQRLKAIEDVLWDTPSEGREEVPNSGGGMSGGMMPSSGYRRDSGMMSSTYSDGDVRDGDESGTRSVSLYDYDVDEVLSDEHVFGNDELESALNADGGVVGSGPVDGSSCLTGTERLEQAIASNSRCIFDADLSSEISRFVERQEAASAEPDRSGDRSDLPVRQKSCRAGMIQAVRVQARVIYAQLVQGRFVQACQISEGVRDGMPQGRNDDIQCDKISADEIYANDIQAEYIQAEKIVCAACKSEFLMKPGRN